MTTVDIVDGHRARTAVTGCTTCGKPITNWAHDDRLYNPQGDECPTCIRDWIAVDHAAAQREAA